MNEYLASRGCVVLSVDHRSGIMHGEAFRNAPGWGFANNSEMFDFVGGAKYLLARKDVDASRGVGIYGLSWGGYVTSTALSQHSDIFKVGFDMAGVHAAIDDSRKKNSALGNIETWNSPVCWYRETTIATSPSTMGSRLLKRCGQSVRMLNLWIE